MTKLEILTERAMILFNETEQDEPWKCRVAKDLNEIVGRVQYNLETSGDESDLDFADAALNIIERVKEFEQIAIV